MMIPPEARPHTPRRMPSTLSVREDEDHNTIPDPRSRALSPDVSTQSSTPGHHPDLDQEVATLSTKLINAINHQTTLDDTLSSTRHELDTARERIAELEDTVAKQQEKLSEDVWMRRSVAEEEKADLRARLATERALRLEAEKDKKKIEQELENLTVSLFEEANKMVITAKEDAAREQEVLNRKNEQLKAQLKDTEGLLTFQQEQLAELKLVMEQMNAEKDDRTGTAPSSPGLSKFDPRESDSRNSDGDALQGGSELLSPTYPTDLSHLLSPVLRTDISAYDDFMSLIKVSKTHSRVSSGSYNGLNPVLGIAGASIASNSSTVSLSAAAASSSSPQSPNTPASAISAGSSAPAVQLPPLKETKFYKRALAEDIEPTLRLDTAPGLSWLARRSVITAITEGTLVVEPVPTTGVFATISKPQFYKCSLCGESRKDESLLRHHRFRTSETETAQRYPLCKYCLGRVRSTCDFLGFLRMVKDGHWRADDAEAERNCWEESVKLREQMFWSRIGGGVVPASHGHAHHPSAADKSTRNSTDEPETTPQEVRSSGPDAQDEATTVTPPSELTIAPAGTDTPTTPPDVTQKAPDTETSTNSVDANVVSANKVDGVVHSETAASTDERPPTPPEKDTAARLSITIPGAFAFNV
ncbi:uncharacterized protein B0I36DRAFT_66613 [Microdochium trichocladiopsis]|uniref:GDP/GTP exchange factor Sec2 N-terminal domain-containing protein n=1 Tax=Microdochium trichocladiopsis TaxID=1682393 RepID=A0A9P8YG68_9PEZI|nr:uncharacterized protein B0I36DRAFT_66613 [Microdochium trichocladiopsis]KAH7037470.1 hypothetical protein B0I36DRAFT_66613 [Microdochium trichocladiopsis]